MTEGEFEGLINGLKDKEFLAIMFYVYDKDKNKKMSPKEWKAMLNDIDKNGTLDDAKIQALFDEANSSEDETIDVDDFITWSFEGGEDFHAVDGNGNVNIYIKNVNIYN